jgi:transcriptional regulator with XRE-family HTH domain
MATTFSHASRPRTSPTLFQTHIELGLPKPATPSYASVEWLDVASRLLMLVSQDAPVAKHVRATSPVERVMGVWSSSPASVTPSVTRLDEAAAPSIEPYASALSILDAVRSELGLTIDEVARATGIGYSTLHYWRRTGAEPRRSTVRNLWRLHSVGSSIVRMLGHDEALGWLQAGAPSPYQCLLAGDIDRVEDLLSRWLFDQPALRQREPAVSIEDELLPDEPPETMPPARLSVRRPARRGLMR